MKQWLVRRGLLATLPVASLVLAFGACSSQSGTPNPTPGARGTEPSSPGAASEEVVTTPAAAARLTQLSQQFTRMPSLPKRLPSLRLPVGILPPPATHQPAEKPAEPTAVLSKGEAYRFVRHGTRLRAEVPAELKAVLIKAATADVAAVADGFTRLEPEGSKIGVEFASKDARRDVEAQVADGTVTYPGAARDGGDLILRVTADSIEDFVVLDRRPAEPHVDYLVNVSEVAGLRLYANTLEFLDKSGDPQVRVKPPRVNDSDGTTHDATLTLDDCAADHSGELPWGRAVTPPGAKQCTVRVSWNDKNVVYPAIVDPVWSTAGSLAVERWKNAAVRLSTGFVLTCGGEDKNGVPLKSCEAFNPSAAAGLGTWATATSMNTGRAVFGLVSLAPASTDVVAVGGAGITTSERFNGATWANSVGDFSTGSWNSQGGPAVTSDGAYLVLIDFYDTPFKLATSNNTWTTGTQNAASLHQYRYNPSIVQVPGQATIMRAGGSYSTVYGDTERYKPSTDSWVTPGPAASLAVARNQALVAVLDASHLMIYGGYGSSNPIASAEIYNVSTNTWAFTPDPLPSGTYAYVYQNAAASSYAFHGSGKMLTTADGNQQIYLYDPTAAALPWTTLNTYSYGFTGMGTFGNLVAAGSKVLAVPVQPTAAGTGVQTACRLFDFGAKGALCTVTAECQSGLVCSAPDASDGVSVCCNTDCSNGCSSCQAKHQKAGGTDGTCAPRVSTESVYSACPYSDPSTCGNSSSYTCDGAGACQKWPNTTSCGNGSCKSGTSQNDYRYCDGAGTCKAQTVTACTAGYQCNYGQCLTYCYNDADYCVATSYCQTWYDGVDFNNSNKCYAKKDAGAQCSGNSATECKSGYCVDGFCCDVACSGVCQACSNTLTGASNGSCKPIKANTVSGECADNGAASCGNNGKCDGVGACQNYASGTACVAASCASSTSRNNIDTCTGTGTCTDNGVTNCAAGYSCVAGVCQTTCADDTQCASAYYCDTVAKQCVADKTQGQACPRDGACSGNANCVDGVCCDSACSGSCRSCLKNRTGLASDGTCGNTLDDTDPENECATGAGYPQSCQAPGLCNGAGACRPYAKLDVACDVDSCPDSTLTTYGCNGAGTCKPKSVPCYPFKCDAANNSCRVACSLDGHCVVGSFCKNGTCVGQLPNGNACTDGAQCKSTHCANIHQGLLQGDVVPMGGSGGSGGAGGSGGSSGTSGTDTGGSAGSGGTDTGGSAGTAGSSGTGGVAPDPGADSPGVCCDTDCQGTCAGCKASIKGFGSDGICEFVKNNTDPASDCEKSSNDACGLDGQCNGAGACRLAPSGTSCGASSCQGNSVLGQSCNGQGDCINNQGGVDCAPYVCRDVKPVEMPEGTSVFQCTNPCGDDNDCQDGYFCADAKCSKKLANGKVCESNGICNSGYCVDGVCCDASCNGQCEACAAPGSEGTCTPVQGDPQGKRAQCDNAGEECGGKCDGVNAAACKYPANGETCGTPACDAGIASASACNGQGACRASPDQECSPYSCGMDNTCLKRCEVDEDCSQGYACDETSQRCLPSASAATCSEDRLVSQGQNGADTPCKPFLCVPASGTCAVSCAFTTDCSPDFVCEPSTKTCLPAPPDSGGADNSSCACRAAGAAPESSSYLALAALGAALTGLRRRKRSRKSVPRSVKPRGFAPESQPSE